MTPEQVTIVVTYIGIGGVFIFWGDWRDYLKDLEKEAETEAAMLPASWTRFLVAFTMLIGIIGWPYFVTMTCYDWLVEKFKK